MLLNIINLLFGLYVDFKLRLIKFKNINDFNESKNAKDFDPFNTTNLNNFDVKKPNINNFEVFSLI